VYRGEKEILPPNFMQKLAESYGGQCLSEKYLGAQTHLEWRCNNGHEWTA